MEGDGKQRSGGRPAGRTYSRDTRNTTRAPLWVVPRFHIVVHDPVAVRTLGNKIWKK